ncbi:hypothetical protein EMIT074MI3_12213 [Bacillus licheniformis]
MSAKQIPSVTYHDSVAQLGERYLDRVEVAGSSPVGIIPNRNGRISNGIPAVFVFRFI